MDDLNNINAISCDDKYTVMISDNNLYVYDIFTKRKVYSKELLNNGILDCDINDNIVVAVSKKGITMIDIANDTEFKHSFEAESAPQTKHIVNHDEDTGEFVVSRIVNGNPIICTKTKMVYGKVFGSESFTVDESDFEVYDKNTSNLYTFKSDLNNLDNAVICKAYDGNTGEKLSDVKDSKNTRLENLEALGYTVDNNNIYAFATAKTGNTGSGLYVISFDKLNKNIVPTLLSTSSMNASDVKENEEILTGKIFEYKNNIYSFKNKCVYKFNKETKVFTIENDLGSVLDGEELFADTSISGMLIIICATGSAVGNVSFKIAKYNLISGTYKVSVVNAPVNGAEADMSNVVFSRKPCLLSDKFVITATSKSINDTKYKPTNIYIDIKTNAAIVSSPSSLQNVSLKTKDAIEFFDEDLISFAGDNEYSNINSKSLTITSTKEPLNGDTGSSSNWRFVSSDNNTALSMGPLFKSGSKVFGQFIDSSEDTEVVINRNGCSIFGAKTFGIPLKKTNTKFGNIPSKISLDVAPDNYSQAALDNDTLLFKFNKTNAVVEDNKANPFAIRSFKPIKSPITVFDVENYYVRVYSGSTSDLFITVDKKTGEIIDSVETERGYGNSITNLSVSDESILVFYENSPNISSLIIHEDGFISLKMYNGTAYGRKIDDSDNSCTIQELDLTLLFDNESSEFAIRRA